MEKTDGRSGVQSEVFCHSNGWPQAHPGNSDCWGSISGSGSGAPLKLPSPGALEPAVGLQSWVNLCESGFLKVEKNSFNINHLELMLLVCSRSPRFLPNSSCLQEQEVGGGHKAIHDDATAAKVLPRKRPAFHGMFADS